MKVKIIKKGARGPDESALTVGQIIKVDGDKMPAFLVGKAVKIDDGLTVATPDAATFTPERAALLKAASGELDPGDFTEAGTPKVGKINAMIDSEAPKFSGNEIAAIWASFEE